MVGPMQVRSAVIPAAGMGTRFLPASKAVPKELLPIGDTPTLQLVIDEALGAGIDHIVVVSSRGKPAIEAYFEPSPEIVDALEASGQDGARRARPQHRRRLAGDDRLPGRAAGPRPRRRLRARGHRRRAVRRAAARRADGRLVAARPHERVCASTGGSVVALKEVPHEEVGRYGVIAPDRAGRRRRRRRRSATWSRSRPIDEAPSDLIIIGRYVLTPDVFDEIAAGRVGALGEIQLTDALRAQAAAVAVPRRRQPDRPLRHGHAARLPHRGRSS